MPCYDKKLEASRSDFYNEAYSTRDVDCVITTGELDLLMREKGWDLSIPVDGEDDLTPVRTTNLPSDIDPDNKMRTGGDSIQTPPSSDSPFPELLTHPGTSSGSYLHSVISDVIATHSGSAPLELNVRTVRASTDYEEYTLSEQDTGVVVFRGAKCYGFRNLQNVVRKVGREAGVQVGRGAAGRLGAVRAKKRAGAGGADAGGEKGYDYVEVMACPGGCVNGGGQLRPPALAAKSNKDEEGFQRDWDSTGVSSVDSGDSAERMQGAKWGDRDWVRKVEEVYWHGLTGLPTPPPSPQLDPSKRRNRTGEENTAVADVLAGTVLKDTCHPASHSQGLAWSDSMDEDAETRRRTLFRTQYRAVETGAVFAAYENYQPFRHTVLAVARCSRIAEAAVLGAIDYKKTLGKTYATDDEHNEALSQCHRRSAERVLKALLANGGIFIKLGQHMASMIVLPIEWTSTMRPLQDQCEPTAYEDIEALVESDLGGTINELFVEFNPKPVGVASLAQVHVGRLRSDGTMVAVKLQHPHLAEFCDIDMEMVEVSLGWIKHWFPEFEFTWLADEMRQNLPKEMDFVHEAANTHRAVKDFQNIRSSLYIPAVVDARKRILIMEYIQGGRVDDLQYLADHNIDRNKVALELARIFSQMVHINGWFHADPHPGNLLIRPSPPSSKSPYNFEIVLLDHGLYFDLDDDLRVNYSRFWLSLIASASPQTNADRRKYAKLVGNITDDLYPVFEAAFTGRAALEGSWSDPSQDPVKDGSFKRGGSVMELSVQNEEEMEAIRAVMQDEGVLLSVFDVLRRVPRRVLMVLKLNDLTRSLDHALATTHSSIRVFLITAKYCTLAVWRDDQIRLISQMRARGLMSFGLLLEYFSCWWHYQKSYRYLVFVESAIDAQAQMAKMRLWLKGLVLGGGLRRAREAAAGLT
ncbi:hypothetical protein EIP91_011699 [Steccherinum ochraceum]|uniref:Iron hydrogenase large subunit C-terminal domain-containing protein n=1 Tax=Steccherinum ochraceum TaxID=92696 RepID=A0A4R0RR02_9APHY|nr:hypothetical protein EIP91_011699 [Steccherinum ochraceum]